MLKASAPTSVHLSLHLPKRPQKEMSELDETEAPAAVEEEEEVNDLPTAIRKVLKNAMVADGCIRGLHEVAKYVDAGKAQVVFLAESCNEPTYKKLVQGLCLEKN